MALVIEDDADIAGLIEAYLLREGLGVDTAQAAEEAERLLRTRDYDIVLLDLGLPGMDGLEFLRRFRERSDVPLLVVSARDSDEERVAALGLGADDFIPKPFSPRFLAARVAAQLRREALGGQLRGSPGFSLRFGSLVLDRSARSLRREGKPVNLTRREYELLEFLASESGRAVGAEELFRRVWGKDYGDLSTVAVHVQRLRRKIEEDPSSPRFLLTQPGLGYRFDPAGGA